MPPSISPESTESAPKRPLQVEALDGPGGGLSSQSFQSWKQRYQVSGEDTGISNNRQQVKDTFQSTSPLVLYFWIMSKPHHLPALLRGTSLLLNPLYPPHGFKLPFPFSPSSRQYQPVFSTLVSTSRRPSLSASLIDRIHTPYSAVPIT